MTGRMGRRTALRGMLAGGQLETVPVSAGLASRLIGEARSHLQAAQAILSLDPAGSLYLAYDAARKGAGAMLAAQGLRATTRGGHMAVQEAARVCSPAFAGFGRLRRRRHDSEYPGPGTPTVVQSDAVEALEQASQMVTAVADLFDSGRLRRVR